MFSCQKSRTGILLYLIAGMVFANVATATVNITINPPMQSIPVDDSVTVDVSFSTVQDLKGVNLKLIYDPAVLHCGGFQKGSGIAPFTVLVSNYDNQKGEAEFLAVHLAKGSGLSSAGGNFCSLIFTAVGSGSSSIILQDIKTVIGNSAGEVIPYKLVNGTVTVTTAVAEPVGTDLPLTYGLAQNYPNPFNPFTRIRYQLPHSGQVTLVIYNILGEKVRQLIQGYQPAGYYEVIWNGRDDFGKQVSSGIYLCRFTANGYSQIRKMVFLP